MSSADVATVVFSSPRFVWDIYVEYLWNYEPNSWVAKAAYTFRVLSLLMFAPVFILTILDVISYVIARTLGVIDDTKASTSEIQNDTSTSSTSSSSLNPPNILVHDTSTSDEGNDADASSPPPTYFHSTMESAGNLKLSGVDMFSPAPSQPPSPTMSRRDLALHAMHQIQGMSKASDTVVKEEEEVEEDGRESGDATPSSLSVSEISSASWGSFAFPTKTHSGDGLQVRQRSKTGVDNDA